MRMQFIIDGKPTMATISRWSWTKTLISMIIHFDNSMSWKFLKITNIDHEKYKNCDFLYVGLADLDWEWMRKYGFNLWIKKMTRDCD